MNFFISALIISICLGIQYFLSSRHNPYLGIIMPIILVIFLTWRYFDGRYNSFLAYVLILGVGMISLWEQWSRGRKKLKENQEKELERMRVHDTL
ncbi:MULTISPECIES: hypothetical protein [Exiguobacterium]|uniref:hypothetical protein n=1 Tax=Exiguobacterium TaxID=33986 RepID=UPI0018A78CAC|nr:MULTISPECIES: hypothetical protein [Exiguobacterium]MBF8153032.1 hypothetical protein [Exiguobacterium sp. TBG-PICH-001]QZY88293.1 hypothetical protein K7G97_08140 [Exiguobacterium acetylicum]